MQRRNTALKHVDSSVYDLNVHAAHPQKAILNIFCNKSVALVGRLEMFFQQELAVYSVLWMKWLAMRLRPCKVILHIVS